MSSGQNTAEADPLRGFRTKHRPTAEVQTPHCGVLGRGRLTPQAAAGSVQRGVGRGPGSPSGRTDLDLAVVSHQETS